MRHRRHGDPQASRHASRRLAGSGSPAETQRRTPAAASLGARPACSRLRYSDGTQKSTLGRMAATVSATVSAVGQRGSRITVAPIFSPA
jgi:hypothetical protein